MIVLDELQVHLLCPAAKPKGHWAYSIIINNNKTDIYIAQLLKLTLSNCKITRDFVFAF